MPLLLPNLLLFWTKLILLPACHHSISVTPSPYHMPPLLDYLLQWSSGHPSSHSCQILAFSAVGKDLKGQLPSHQLLITNPHIFSKITFTSSPNGWHKSKQFHLRLSSWGERIKFVMRYCHWSISFLHTPSHYTLRTTLHPPLAYTLSSVCYLLHQVFHLDAALVGQSRSSHQCCLCIRALYYILRHLRLEQQSLHQHISHDCVVNLIYY